ncbi:Hypothetical predicted protein [Mytilus galloprovincialis]|uniref:Uncharacterized protein n=1 Tax=Mytilus galloprovincialis TaxID=29158 RepID=A0A8B6CT17_MYTGA|nr:Hypothetical predicted protein [Mytilus galloprovincialis]
MWEIFNDVTKVFERLSKKPVLVSDADMELIEAFIVVMYDRTTTTFDINESRLELFARKQRQYDTIRPTRAALLDHTKLPTYRGGHVWGQAVTHHQHLPSLDGWRWVKENADGMGIPRWTQLAAIVSNEESRQELHKCGCKKTCSGNSLKEDINMRLKMAIPS